MATLVLVRNKRVTFKTIYFCEFCLSDILKSTINNRSHWLGYEVQSVYSLGVRYNIEFTIEIKIDVFIPYVIPSNMSFVLGTTSRLFNNSRVWTKSKSKLMFTSIFVCFSWVVYICKKLLYILGNVVTLWTDFMETSDGYQTLIMFESFDWKSWSRLIPTLILPKSVSAINVLSSTKYFKQISLA